MIIGKNFIFLHVPKTGGTWMIRAFAAANIPTQQFQQNSTHYPLGYLPKKHENLPAYLLVRNPWEWYVSHLEYVRQKIIPNLGWNFSNKQYVLLFRTIRSCVDEMPSLQYEVESLSEHPRKTVQVLKYEDGLISAFEKITQQAAPASVRNLPSQNVSQHPHYREYYDDQSQKLVAEKNSKLIRQFKYSF